MFFASTQETFYIVGIVYMIFMMVVVLTFLIIVLVAFSKLRAMKKKAKDRIDSFTSFGRKSRGFLDGFLNGLGR